MSFVARVDDAFGAVAQTPAANPHWRSRYPFQKHVIARFPYIVFFVALPDAVEIVAVAHAKRRPGYWLRR